MAVGSQGARRGRRRFVHRRVRRAARRWARTAGQERDRSGPARSVPAGQPGDRDLRTGLAGGAARANRRHRFAGRRTPRPPGRHTRRAGLSPTRSPRQLHVAASPRADHRATSGGRGVVLRTAARGRDAQLDWRRRAQHRYPGQRDLSQSGGRTDDGLASSRGDGPAAHRGLPDHRRHDTRTITKPDADRRRSSAWSAC